ncbi:hypothetical protein PP747_gp028 [Rhizobium phage RHph_Y38]|uniref:Uncharacterized protein n=1 Tax=Rhizobium phage RHph_Y38 TaxID=2509781 RepID=A0A7S5R8J5_9CAUD|nr:hypothetical protein PP747_gp028 [Rhizobium phage RHph_Y38]QIG67729.1 hypothetical protein EVB52_028 [Rhizobium phage RHph_Y38]
METVMSVPISTEASLEIRREFNKDFLVLVRHTKSGGETGSLSIGKYSKELLYGLSQAVHELDK